MVMEMARRNEQREREISWYERKIVANTETTKKKKKKDERTRGGWSWNMKRTWCGVWNESGSCTTKGLRASNIHTNDRTIFIPLEANRFNFIFILFRCVWIVCVSLSGVQCSYDIWVLFFYYFFLLCFRFFGTVHFSFKVIRFWLLLGQF